MTGVRSTVVKYDSWGQIYNHWGQIWPALIGVPKNECSIIMDVQPTCDPNMVICFMKYWKQSIYVRTVSSQILFTIGTVNSFLAGIDRNQVYVACYFARTTHESEKQAKSTKSSTVLIYTLVGRLLQNEPDISYPLQSHKKPILVIFGSILSMGSLSMTQKRVHTTH